MNHTPDSGPLPSGPSYPSRLGRDTSPPAPESSLSIWHCPEAWIFCPRSAHLCGLMALYNTRLKTRTGLQQFNISQQNFNL